MTRDALGTVKKAILPGLGARSRKAFKRLEE